MNTAEESCPSLKTGKNSQRAGCFLATNFTSVEAVGRQISLSRSRVVCREVAPVQR